MHRFDFGYQFIVIGNLREAFILCVFGKIFIEHAPFFTFAGGGFGKILFCISDYPCGISGSYLYGSTFEKGEESACVAEFLFGCFEKYGSNLFITFFTCFFCEECIS